MKQPSQLRYYDMFSVNVGEASVTFDQDNDKILVKFDDDGQTAGAALRGGIICIDIQYKEDIKSSFMTVVTLTEDHELVAVSWLGSKEFKTPQSRHFSGKVDDPSQLYGGRVYVAFKDDPATIAICSTTANNESQVVKTFPL